MRHPRRKAGSCYTMSSVTHDDLTSELRRLESERRAQAEREHLERERAKQESHEAERLAAPRRRASREAGAKLVNDFVHEARRSGMAPILVSSALCRSTTGLGDRIIKRWNGLQGWDLSRAQGYTKGFGQWESFERLQPYVVMENGSVMEWFRAGEKRSTTYGFLRRTPCKEWTLTPDLRPPNGDDLVAVHAESVGDVDYRVTSIPLVQAMAQYLTNPSAGGGLDLPHHPYVEAWPHRLLHS